MYSGRKRKARKVSSDDDQEEELDFLTQMLKEQAKTEKKLQKVLKEEQAKDKEARVSAEFLQEEKEEEAKFNDIIKKKQEEALADRLPPRTLRLEIFTPHNPKVKPTLPPLPGDAAQRWHHLRNAMLKNPQNVLRVGAIAAVLHCVPEGKAKPKLPQGFAEYLVETMLYSDIPLATLAYENLVRIAFHGVEAVGNIADPVYLLTSPKPASRDNLGWNPTPQTVMSVLKQFGYSVEDGAATEISGRDAQEEAVKMYAQRNNLALYLQALGCQLRNQQCSGWEEANVICNVLKLFFLLMLDTRLNNSSCVTSAAVCVEAIIVNMPESSFNCTFYEACAKAFGCVVDFAAPRVIYEETGVDRDALDDELSRHALSLTLLERLRASDGRNKLLRAHYAEQLCLSHELIPSVAEKRSSNMLSRVQLVLQECKAENTVANHAFEAVATALDALEADVRRVHTEAREETNQRKIISRDYHRWVLYLRTIGFVERLVISKENRYRKKQMQVITAQYQLLQSGFEKKFHLAFTHLQDKIATLQSMYLPFNESRSHALSTKKKSRQMLLNAFTTKKTAEAVG